MGVEKKESPFTPEQAVNKKTIASANKSRGKELEINNEDGHEIWTYKDSAWCGPLVVVIPLLLPVCDASETYFFKDDVLVKALYSRPSEKGAFCSIFPICDGSDCKFCFVST